MATPAHCLYCFDALSSSLERRSPLPLRQTIDLWDQYNDTRLSETITVTTNTVSSDHAVTDEEDDELEEADDDDDEDEEPVSRPTRRLRTGFDRLIAPSPASGSSSSSVSTPSTSSSTRTPLSGFIGSSVNSSRSSVSLNPPLSSRVAAVEQKSPLFVTWNIVGRSGHKSLRGCIGTFEAQELDTGLRTYAMTSAFDDSRFMPITKRELPSLEVAVTLLTDFEPAPTPTSWDLGVHGIKITFTHHSKRYGSTYLPDVPTDQGWTKDETLASLMRKAGWSGRNDDWKKVADLKVVRYQGKKVTVGYREWMDWREWVDENGGGDA